MAVIALKCKHIHVNVVVKYVELCARKIAEVSNSDKIVVEKSTLPVRTAEAVKTILDKTGTGVNFEVLSNPGAAEGTAINDLFKSDRVLIGGDQTESGKIAISKLVDIYKTGYQKKKSTLPMCGHRNYLNWLQTLF